MTHPDTAERTALYRIFGDADLLLYIGISKDFGGRWKQHARTQPWWGEMRRLTVDGWYDFRVEAEIAEEVAIKADKPKYNKTYADPPADPPAKGSRGSSKRHPVTGETVEEVMAGLHAKWAAWDAEAADHFPGWGWWPDDAWWRTWWRLERDHLGSDQDALATLRGFYCPKLSATHVFGWLLHEDDRPDAHPESWIQEDFRRGPTPPGELDYVWSAHCVIQHAARPTKLCGAARDVQGEFFNALLAAGRCGPANPGYDAAAFGFYEDTEAMAVTTILVDLAWGKTDTAVECIKVLRGDAERGETAA